MGVPAKQKDWLELAIDVAEADIWDDNLASDSINCEAIRVAAELGYDEQEALSFVGDFFKLVHPDDAHSIRQAIYDHLAGVTANYRCKFRLREKNSGRWVWYANFGKAVDLEQGRRFVGVTFNIDDREVSEDRFSRIFDKVPVGLALYDERGQILGLNKAFSTLTGLSLEEIPTLSRLWERACPDLNYRQKVEAMWQNISAPRRDLKSPEPRPFEIDMSGRNGQKHTFLINSASLGETGASSNLMVLYDFTERKSSEIALQHSERQLRFVLQGSELGFWDWDILTGKVERNERWAEILGYNHQEIQETTQQWTDFIHPDDREAAWDSIKAVLEGRANIHRIEYRMLHKDGTVRWILDQASVMQRTPDGKPWRMCGTHTDVTERKRIDEELRQGEERLQLLIEHAPASLAMFDTQMRYIAASRRWRKEYGLGNRDLRGESHYEVIPDIPERWKMVHQRGLAGEVIRASEDRFERADGSILWMHWEVQPWHTGKGDVAGIVIFTEDITEQRKSKEKIEHLALHDPLTELPNRALFLDRLGQALAAAQRNRTYGAILFVDLDQFKRINDVYGHQFGDRVLGMVAATLRRELREGDSIARIGGDEFVVLLSDLSSDMQAAVNFAVKVGEKLRTTLGGQKSINEQAYLMSASIGVSIFPQGRKTVEDLIREADIAMYRAKERGRNRLVFFEDKMQSAIAERFALEQSLRKACDEQELQLYLQSKVDSKGQVVGAEALLRWMHPKRGMIMPATFVPLAEETGLVLEIGEWVLREACRVIARTNQLNRNLRISVNVSPRQFHQADFVDRVRSICAETGADPLYLTLEITEGLLIDRASEVVSRMLELAELGVRFSIDDFGTGYSSLSYLKRLPINELKIDKSFVQDIPQDSNDVALVETILSIAHHLRLDVVAEGVESDAQFQFLIVRQCEHYQGYFFHRPQPAQEWIDDLTK